MSDPKTTATEFFRANKAPDKTTHIAVRKGLDVCLFVVRNEWCDYSSVESGFMIAKSFWDIFEVTEFTRASELTSGVTAEEKTALISGFNDAEEETKSNSGSVTGDPVRDLLLCASRQFRHNNGEGFVFGYDAEDVRTMFRVLLTRSISMADVLAASESGNINTVWDSTAHRSECDKPVFSDELMEAFDHYDGFDEFALESAIMESKDKAFSLALKLYREMK